MKTFLKYTLASMLAFILVFFLLFFVIIGGIGSSFSTEKTAAPLKEKNILELTLSSPIHDLTSDNPFENLDPFSMKVNESSSLKDIITAIHNAKTDDRIQGIYLNLSSFQGGIAFAQEIRNALEDFKLSGKFIYAYGDSYSQTAYYLASTADKIYLQPQGAVDLKGLYSQFMFFKNALDKFNIEVQIFRHGKFKGAVEPYFRNDLSAENREQMEVLLHSTWDQMVKDIAASRGLTEKELNLYCDKLYGVLPETAVKYHIVDSLISRNAMMQILQNQMQVSKEKDLNLVSVGKYIPNIPKDKVFKNKIAIVYAQGEIGTKDGSTYEIGMKNISNAIKKAADDDQIKAIVLRVNSPGGSVLTSDIIYQEIIAAKAKKPVVASFGNYAASGGYYISCAADKIYSNATTLTGSIGVFGMMPNPRKAVEKYIGLRFDEVATNANSSFGSTMMQTLSPYQAQIIQESIETIYTGFVSKVAQGRNMSFEEVDKIAQGRVWSGIDALGIGLVDEIGSLQDAIDGAADMAQIENYNLVEFPLPKSPMESLMETFHQASCYSYLRQFEVAEIPVFRSLGRWAYQLSQEKGVSYWARLPFLYQINQ